MGQRWGGFLCLTASLAWGQQVPAVASPDALFRTTTKLVQVSVIAQDKQGKPVLDLRRDEFQIFDNGSPQTIQLFLAETERPGLVAPAAKALGTFTNQISLPAGSHSGYSVILIDNLSTDFGDPFIEDGSAYARLQTLKMLRSIPLGEKIAIYALQRKLQVICELTSDRDLLERQLHAWKESSDTPGTSGAVDPSPPDLRGNPAAEAARIDALQRVTNSNAEMEQVADHLAGIPGRKNLIWLANRFAISPKALQKLTAAGVSIYPVDPAGAKSPDERGRAMDVLAAYTGGVAYHGRNDLDVAIREAIDDGRVSYTLGFYQPGDDKKATVHQLGVRVDRPGVSLRYRTTYQTEAQERVSNSPIADFVKAINRPVDATAIPISASATRMQDRLDLTVSINGSSLGLELSQGLWKGKAELVTRFMTADGVQAGDVLSQTVTFNLRPATYASMLQHGVPYHKVIKIPAKAVEVKVLVGNLASGRIGTLAIPLSEVQSGAPKQEVILDPRTGAGRVSPD